MWVWAHAARLSAGSLRPCAHKDRVRARVGAGPDLATWQEKVLSHLSRSTHADLPASEGANNAWNAVGFLMCLRAPGVMILPASSSQLDIKCVFFIYFGCVNLSLVTSHGISLGPLAALRGGHAASVLLATLAALGEACALVRAPLGQEPRPLRTDTESGWLARQRCLLLQCVRWARH